MSCVEIKCDQCGKVLPLTKFGYIIAPNGRKVYSTICPAHTAIGKQSSHSHKNSNIIFTRVTIIFRG